MQNEINEIRESLSGIFQEIAVAMRNNAAADQDLKNKIQSLNEQAVRNETAFAQLADAADQSQSKLRGAVTEMQLASERMRDELSSLNSTSQGLEAVVGDRGERVAGDMDQLTQDIHVQLERRREHFRKMVNDVAAIGDSLRSLVDDLREQRKVSDDAQGKIQGSLQAVDSRPLKDLAAAYSPMGERRSAVPATMPQAGQPLQAMAGGIYAAAGAAGTVPRAGLAGMAGSARPVVYTQGMTAMPAPMPVVYR